MSYIDQQPYYGTIVDQGVFESKGNKTFANFYVRLEGKVKNPDNPESDLESVAPEEITVMINLDAPEEQLKWKVLDLQSLGFTGTDLRQLNPKSDNHQNFRGQKVQVKPREWNGKFYWDFSFVRARKKPNEASAETIAKKNEAFKRAMEALNKPKDVSKAKKEDVPF
jgi:hypothetical protein